MSLDQRREFGKAAVGHQGADPVVLRGGSDAGCPAHRDAQHADPSRAEAPGHKPIYRTTHIKPLRAPEPEAGATALPVTPEIDHQHREASPAERDSKVGEFPRDSVAEVPVELLPAVGI